MRVPASRRKAASEETRRLILAAAKDLYSERGFREVPIRELAAKVGVAEGTIFSHFPDKSSLLAAAVMEEVDLALSRAFTTLPETASCKEKLLHIARALYSHYGANPILWRAYVKESLFLGGEWGMRIVRSVEQFIEFVSLLIEEEKKKGKYDPEADSQTAARFYFSAYFFELLAGLSAPEFDLESMCTNLGKAVDQWERGILRRPWVDLKHRKGRS